MSYNWKCCSFYPNNFDASALAATYSLRQRQPCRHIAAKEKYWQQEIYSSAHLNPFVCPFTCFLAHSFGALLAYCFACLLHAKTKSKKKLHCSCIISEKVLILHIDGHCVIDDCLHIVQEMTQMHVFAFTHYLYINHT